MDGTSPLVVNPSEEDQAGDVWRACLDLIKEKVNTQSFKTWFEPIVPLYLRGGRLTVQVPSQFFYDWLEEHYYTIISATIETVLGKDAHLEYSVKTDDPQLEIDYQIPPQGAPRVERRAFPPQPTSFTTLQPQRPADRSAEAFQSFLNARYTFENFIKGDSNQLARAAASAVANNPGGTSFNPLVIYGGTGLGKTHLMHAIGNYAIANGKARRVIYVSSEKFTVEFVESIQRDTANEFAGFYRSMDILIVDDIQFFAGKERTQDHFFHTFN